MTDETVGLDQIIIDRALAVSGGGTNQGISRAVIDGAVVIYHLDDPPLWLRPVLHARDENGSVLKAMHAMVIPEDGQRDWYTVHYEAGEAMTGGALADELDKPEHERTPVDADEILPQALRPFYRLSVKPRLKIVAT